MGQSTRVSPHSPSRLLIGQHDLTLRSYSCSLTACIRGCMWMRLFSNTVSTHWLNAQVGVDKPSECNKKTGDTLVDKNTVVKVGRQVERNQESQLCWEWDKNLKKAINNRTQRPDCRCVPCCWLSCWLESSPSAPSLKNPHTTAAVCQKQKRGRHIFGIVNHIFLGIFPAVRYLRWGDGCLRAN